VIGAMLLGGSASQTEHVVAIIEFGPFLMGKPTLTGYSASPPGLDRIVSLEHLNWCFLFYV
jgi:hypothetical protein